MLQANSNHLFDPEDVTIAATSAPSVGALAAGGAGAGPGGPGMVVRLELTARLGVLERVFDTVSQRRALSPVDADLERTRLLNTMAEHP